MVLIIHYFPTNILVLSISGYEESCQDTFEFRSFPFWFAAISCDNCGLHENPFLIQRWRIWRICFMMPKRKDLEQKWHILRLLQNGNYFLPSLFDCNTLRVCFYHLIRAKLPECCDCDCDCSCYCLNQASLTIRTKGRAGKFPVGGNQ